jgi:isopentenyl-diphosphate delta-isomerase
MVNLNMETKRNVNSLNGKRKEEHLRISLNEKVGFKGITTGLENYRFIHQAMPYGDLKDIDLSTTLLRKRLEAPIMISSMVGGIKAARRLNRNLAEAAQTLGLAMGVGSQRCLVDAPEVTGTYWVRDVAPDILLFANVGAIQLNYGYTVKQLLKVVRSIEADALILHLNPLQEALQIEGNTNFSGLLSKIKKVCAELPVPVLIKEIGCGISEETASFLVEAGVAGIDVAGAGGTCWSEIEKMRLTDNIKSCAASEFASWGIPTSDSLIMTRKAAPDMPIIASGGIRTGMDAAKAIALGADAIGIGGPLLQAADKSACHVIAYLKEIIEVLKVVMFCTRTDSIIKLKNSPFLRRV